MSKEQRWPDVLWIVRHGESAGNVARDVAEAAGHIHIEIATRDVDVPLSPLGERQAYALGHWFAERSEAERPTVVFTSPYLRAKRTAELAMASAGLDPTKVPLVIDERLREREFGILDGLTKYGIKMRYPDQDAMRAALCKFYYRPPGGESWCDVILRLRNMVDTITRDYRQERVLIVCHQVVVFCFRYLLEQMTEEQILHIDRQGDLANCSVTTYRYDQGAGLNGGLVLEKFNEVAPLLEEDTKITSEPDVPVAPK